MVSDDSQKVSINDSSGSSRVQFHNKLFLESPIKENQNDLESLINEFKRRNIIPVIITPPVSYTYYNYANKTILKKNLEIINEICLKYNCNYFDYFKDRRFVLSDFKDNDHLNILGAEKFSLIINNEILERKAN